MSQVTCQGAATSGSRSDLKDKKVLGNFLAKDIKCKKSDLKDDIKKTFSLLLQYSQLADIKVKCDVQKVNCKYLPQNPNF